MSQDEIKAKKKTLEGFFNPKGIAVIGASASPEKIGYQILNNLIVGGFEGKIYPINPKSDEILGIKAYKTVTDVPGEIDLAVITVPAPFVIASMEECGKKGVKNAAIITSGFGEVGNHADEDKIKAIAAEHGIGFLGPNILGSLYMPSKINASFGPSDVLPGKIAFISQSGALAIALMGWTVMEKIGLASMSSLGNKADVDETDLVEYFNTDDNVDVVLIYMEGIKDGRKFLNTKVEKPVIVLKVGTSSRGAKAAASHTGSLSGADGIYNAVFKQMGIMRAKDFTEAFGWARAFSLPKSAMESAAIITNGGGIGVATTDECEEQGIGILEDPEWLEAKFRCTMPDFGSTKNPIDITGGSGVGGYREATKISFAEAKIDSVIVLYCETAVTNPSEVAQSIIDEFNAAGKNKPVVCCFVGGERSRAAIHLLSQNGIPAFDNIGQTISCLSVLKTWKEISSREKDVPEVGEAPQAAKDIIEKVRAEGRDILMEHEARQVLELCGVPTPNWCFATTADEAVKLATEKDVFPLAMKIASPDIVHKTDVGGVMLNIRDAEELRAKFNEMMEKIKKIQPEANLLGVNLIKMMKGVECIIGMSNDPQFGSVVMFGLGGVFVEVLKDVTFRVVPFGKVEAARMISEIKAQKVLNGFRGMEAHKPSIIQTLCAIQKLSSIVKEIDVNPLMTDKNGSYAVDARIVI